jgi:hypothetical protein
MEGSAKPKPTPKPKEATTPAQKKKTSSTTSASSPLDQSTEGGIVVMRRDGRKVEVEW